MKTKFYTLLMLIFSISQINAQLPNGSIAPDFIAKDINGVEYHLYDILAEGKSVVIDFSATWCGPCWSYHNSGTLHDYMEAYGPEGTNESMVFFIETDGSTTIEDLYGTGSSTKGNWVEGTIYPIIDEAYIASMYEISAVPTVFAICPDRIIKNVGTSSPSTIINWSRACSSIESKPELSFRADTRDGCNSLDVQFTSTSWPQPDTYLWNFGDGNTSAEKNPIHKYETTGDFEITLTASNQYGESSLQIPSFIHVGEGGENTAQFVKPKDKNFGEGKYFSGGHQGLIFDALNDIVLSKVTVFSSEDRERTIVLFDEAGTILNRKTINIPTGKQVIDLNMFIPQGSNYRLGMHSDAYLYRNNVGVNYPYTVDNLVSITKSTASTEPGKYYYYFYNWEVREAGCDGISSTFDIPNEQVNIYPNPTYDIIIIEANNNEIPTVYNNIGKLLYLPISKNKNHWVIDMKSLDSGIYYVKIGNVVRSISKI